MTLASETGLVLPCSPPLSFRKGEVGVHTDSDLPGVPGCMLVLRPLHWLNQKPPAGSCWSDGLSHNPQLAQHQVRRLLWKPIQTEPDMFSPGGPDVQMGFSAWLLPTHLIFPQVDKLVPLAETQSEGSFGNQERGNPFLATLLVPVRQKEGKEYIVR